MIRPQHPSGVPKSFDEARSGWHKSRTCFTPRIVGLLLVFQAMDAAGKDSTTNMSRQA